MERGAWGVVLSGGSAGQPSTSYFAKIRKEAADIPRGFSWGRSRYFESL